MLSFRSSVLCLDWDKRTLRFVVARVGRGQMRLEEAHSHRIPSGTDVDEPAAFGEFIAQTLARHRVKLKQAVVDIPRDRAVINRLKLPPTPLADLPAAVHFQALRELPFPMDEASVDYVIDERDPTRKLATGVMLAAVRKDVLDRVCRICSSAGLTPRRIGLRPYANLLAVTRLPAMSDRRVLFVDIGPSVTEIDVMRGDLLAFTRSAGVSVPFAAGQLVSDDSRISSKSELSEMQLAEQVESTAVEELVVQITRTLQAYRATEPNAVIDQIVVAGGTGVEHAVLAAIDERFGLPAMLFDPTLSLGEKESEAPKLRQFSAALGLAWGMSREGLLELDFLRPKKPVPRGATLKRRLRVVGVGVATLAVGTTAAAVYDMMSLRSQVDDATASADKLRDELIDVLKMQNRVSIAEEWSTSEQRSIWLDHLLLLTRASIDPGKKMIVTQMSCSEASCEISLKIACDNWEIATEFVNAVNAIEVNGKKPFFATQGKYEQSTTADLKFKGSVPVTVQLPLLREHRDGAKKRDKEMEKRTRL